MKKHERDWLLSELSRAAKSRGRDARHAVAGLVRLSEEFSQKAAIVSRLRMQPDVLHDLHDRYARRAERLLSGAGALFTEE